MLETLFRLEGEVVINKTPAYERIQNLCITSWIVIEKEQLTKINLGSKEILQ
jgi:hypothetical protein